MAENEQKGIIEKAKEKVIEGMHKVAEVLRLEEKSAAEKLEEKAEEIRKDAADTLENETKKLTMPIEPRSDENEDIYGYEVKPVQESATAHKSKKAQMVAGNKIQDQAQNDEMKPPESPVHKVRETIAEGIHKVAEFIKPEEKSTTEELKIKVNEIRKQAADTIEQHADKLQESTEPQSTIDWAREKIADTMQAAADRVKPG